MGALFMRRAFSCRGVCDYLGGRLFWEVADCLPQAFQVGLSAWIMPIASWAFFLAPCIWRMEFIFISPRSAGMKRESGTISPARSDHSREGAAGHHVDAGSLARTCIHRNAGSPGHDRRQP